jgi:hypothetical protein
MPVDRWTRVSLLAVLVAILHMRVDGADQAVRGGPIT